ncbi:MAG: methyltransferase domain-containing protein [Luteolibacter sp.]
MNNTPPTKPTALERLDVATCDDLFQVHLHNQRYDFTLNQIQREDKLLEVGTGLGVFSESLANKVNSYQGIEYDKETCETAKLRVPNPEWITEGDAQSLQAESNSFDVVVCLEVLEHLPDYRKALDEIARVLRPGGKLIASIPYVRIGAPSKINPHHLYEPGEQEFKDEMKSRFSKVDIFYQRFSETFFETCIRRFRLRKFFGKHTQYAQLSKGDSQQMSRVILDNSRSGMLLGLLAVSTKT